MSGGVDLHAHTTASDGLAAPAALAETAARAGLSAVAVTDHDTVAGIAEATRAAESLGIRLVPGVELSVFDDARREVHVLGLHLRDLDAIDARLVRVREARHERAASIVDRLNTLGVPVTLDAVLKEAAGGAVGRPHVARALIAGGWARDIRDAFDRWLGAGRPANVDKERVSLADGIAMIHDAGGIAVFAHPAGEGVRERIEPFVALGLDGLEVRHPSHSAEDSARIGALADFFGLVPSGGSDWHGAESGARALGGMNVDAEWLARQDARVGRVRGAASTA